MWGPAARLSNTSATYPREGDNPGKLGIIPRRGDGWWNSPVPERAVAERPRPPEDGPAAYQVVGGVMARQAEDG